MLAFFMYRKFSGVEETFVVSLLNEEAHDINSWIYFLSKQVPLNYA